MHGCWMTNRCKMNGFDDLIAMSAIGLVDESRIGRSNALSRASRDCELNVAPRFFLFVVLSAR